MSGCGVVFHWFNIKFNLIAASLVGIILNGLVLPLLLIPLLGVGFFISMIGPLLLGSIINVVLAGILYRIVDERIDL
jgi:hypothetical protein